MYQWPLLQWFSLGAIELVGTVVITDSDCGLITNFGAFFFSDSRFYSHSVVFVFIFIPYLNTRIVDPTHTLVNF